jgi:hypothetical protein
MIVFGWNPTQKFQSALFVEDDIEMSPLYYWFLDFCLRKTLKIDKLAGCSFYSPKVNELSFESKHEWDPKRINLGIQVRNQLKPFLLFQLPSSWGALYKSDHWSEFQRFFLYRSLNPKLSLIKNVRSNFWEKSWKRFIFTYLQVYDRIQLFEKEIFALSLYWYMELFDELLSAWCPYKSRIQRYRYTQET